MESNSREDEAKNPLNEKMRNFIEKDIFPILKDKKKGIKTSEKEVENLIERFIKEMG